MILINMPVYYFSSRILWSI